MHSKIALVGAGASGKDFLRSKFQDRGFVYGVSSTTRPPRNGEENGVDYYFLTDEEFNEGIDRQVRLDRLNARGDFDNPERRIEEDDKQFRNFSNFDCKITNEDF